MTYLFILLQAQSDGIASLVSSLLPFILIIAVFYFLILRPQQKRQKERAKLLEGVKKGDKIITSGGIHGLVEGVEDDSVLVKIEDNVKVKTDKAAIGTIVGLKKKKKKK